MNRWIRMTGWAVIAFILILVLELASYTIYRFVILQKAGNLTYNPPETVTKSEYERYLAIRDPKLGWPSIETLNSNKHDVSGSRPVPAFPTPGNECVSLYGDSFTYAEEVDDAKAWGNLLAEQLKCRVSNFAISGYGTDQAYLRFKNNTSDHAPITILGIFPHNILRNVNQYRFLLSGGGSPFSFKPRFVIEDKNLRLVPIPQIPYKELGYFWENPRIFLKYESFLPNSSYGGEIFQFPYLVSLIKVLFKERVINRLLKKPSWTSFLRQEHPTKAMEITARIALRFVEHCHEKHCFVVIFPTPSSYNFFIENNHLIMQPLITKLETLDVPVLDLTRGISERLNEKSYCEILTHPKNCNGHFSTEGNRMIADIVYDYLSSFLNEENK